MNYFLHLTVYFWIYAIIAMGLNLVLGWIGRISLAHAGWVALGAYTYAVLTTSYHLTFLPAIILVIIIGGAASVLLSLPSWRFYGDYFVMITLVVQSLLFGFARNLYSPDYAIGTIHNLTNGPFGIAGIPKPNLYGYSFTSFESICIFYGILFLLFALIFRLLVHSPWGRILKALRDDERTLQGFGKPIRSLKIGVFAISSIFACVGGAMLAAYIGYIDPSTASLDESILWLTVVIVGGLGTFRGSLIGAAVILLIPEILRLVPFEVSANIRFLCYGLLLVLLIHLRPQGLAGNYRLG